MIAMLSKKLRQTLPANIDKKLADAIGEVARLQQRWLAIKAELARRCDWSSFESRAKAANSEYAKQPTPENLEKLIFAEFLLEQAQSRLAHLRRAFAYGDAVQHQFAAEFSDWRTKLSTACALRLQKAKANLENVTATEHKRLGDEYDTEEVQSSPVVKRAARAVQQCEFRLKKIATDSSEIAWSQNAGAVLNDDE